MSFVTFEVTHRTHYVYERDVSASYGQLHVLPRELPGQRVVQATLSIEPEPQSYRERRDFFGNRTSYFALHEPHRRLSVTARSVVEVDEPVAELSLFGQRPWELARDTVARGGPQITGEVTQYLLDSPRVTVGEPYREYARASFAPGCGTIDAIRSLVSRIHADFAYAPGATSVSTPLRDAFDRRTGVCQDFAHVAIACLRSVGLPARYVSGYLETEPPPGRERLIGVDGSHAWPSVFVPDAGWVGVDPTNDQFVGGRYVCTAIGRDYSDVPPMNGVIYTEGATEQLDVEVDVARFEP